MNLLDKFRKLPVFRIVPVESEMTEIAITDDPAIEEFFVKFSNEPIKIEFTADQQIITGPVMIPEKLIYRNDSLGERFVTYDKEGIQKAASLFMKNRLKFNEEHSKVLLNIDVLESYFASEQNAFNVPEGSWIVSAKVNDEALWNQLKEKNSGFSFQAMFSNEMIGVEEINFNKTEEVMNLKEKLHAAINAVLFAEEVPPVDPVEPTVEEPTKEPVTEERIQEMIDASIMIASEQIMIAVQELVNQLNESKATVEEMKSQLSSVEEMKSQIEAFSKQPLTQPISSTEVQPIASSFAYLKGQI